jgi:DNA-binding response OmpR family regulator
MARIAVAEDNKHLRDLLRTLLRLKGHEVQVFHDGQEALEGIDEHVDLLLSDVQMPRLDGIELCAALRERFGKEALPILMISVLDGEDDILRALEAGANDYLIKPFSPALVKAKVAHHLRMKRQAESKPAPARSPSPDGQPRLPGLDETRHGEAARESGTRPSKRKDPRFPFRFERYDLLSILGRGSYGVVYEAQRVADETQMALKVLDREVSDDRELLARYFREVGLLSSLQCPSIVRFLASGYSGGRYFLGMELLQGTSAWNRLQDEGPLDARTVCVVGRDLCQAILALGTKNLVHRDIKPANVMLCGERAVLIDFGLAKARSDHDLTSPEEFLGTAEFIPPEVIEGATEDSATDLYAVGVTLYELLVDKNPYTATTTSEVLERVASRVPPDEVRSLDPRIPAPLSRLVAALTHPKRGSRLTDPAEARRRFEALLETY